MQVGQIQEVDLAWIRKVVVQIISANSFSERIFHHLQIGFFIIPQNQSSQTALCGCKEPNSTLPRLL
jgi:hypothetical protein